MGRLLRLFPLLAGLALVGGYVFANRTTVVFEAEGAFGTVQVLESPDGLRALQFGPGRNRQSALYPGRALDLELAYSRVAMVGLALVPPDGRILYVGLGGGAMPSYTRAILPEARIDVVEIDPLVVEVAGRYFGFTPDSAMRVHVGDGRAFLEDAPPGSWDLIVLDAFSESGIPRALTTREFLHTVSTRLAPRGIVVSNVPTAHPLSQRMFATYREVFPELHILPVRRHRQRIVVAGTGDRVLDAGALIAATRALAERADLGFDLPALVEGEGVDLPAPGGPVLSDSVGLPPG